MVKVMIRESGFFARLLVLVTMVALLVGALAMLAEHNDEHYLETCQRLEVACEPRQWDRLMRFFHELARESSVETLGSGWGEFWDGKGSPRSLEKSPDLGPGK